MLDLLPVELVEHVLSFCKAPIRQGGRSPSTDELKRSVRRLRTMLTLNKSLYLVIRIAYAEEYYRYRIARGMKDLKTMYGRTLEHLKAEHKSIRFSHVVEAMPEEIERFYSALASVEQPRMRLAVQMASQSSFRWPSLLDEQYQEVTSPMFLSRCNLHMNVAKLWSILGYNVCRNFRDAASEYPFPRRQLEILQNSEILKEALTERERMGVHAYEQYVRTLPQTSTNMMCIRQQCLSVHRMTATQIATLEEYAYTMENLWSTRDVVRHVLSIFAGNPVKQVLILPPVFRSHERTQIESRCRRLALFPYIIGEPATGWIDTEAVAVINPLRDNAVARFEKVELDVHDCIVIVCKSQLTFGS